MDENLAKIWIALVGSVGVIVGAIITALAATYSAKQKVRELTLQYEQKLKDTYLANARQYTNGLYVPLSIALEELRTAYEQFRSEIDLAKKTAPEGAIETFEASIVVYLTSIQKMMDRGADAFMTSALEDQLRSFNSFVRNSVGATVPVRKVVFEFDVSWFGFASLDRFEWKAKGAWTRGLTGNLFVNLAGVGIGYRAAEMLAAPLPTPSFEESFVTRIGLIKRLIKEVTLGAQNS